MEEQDSDTKDVVQEVFEAPRGARKFLLCNATRSRTNRTLRAQQPKHHGLKQYLAGGKYRVIRGRPIVLTEEEVGRYYEEICLKVQAGIFELRTQDGRVVDVTTGRPVHQQNATVPLPNPPLDSIANDKQNVGERMPQFIGGSTEMDETGDLPDLVKGAEGPEVQSEPVVPTPALEVPPPPPADPIAEDEVPDFLGGDVPDAAPTEATPPPAPSDGPTTKDESKASKQSKKDKEKHK